MRTFIATLLLSVLCACGPISTPPTATSTPRPKTPTQATDTQSLQAELNAEGHVYITRTITSNGTLKPPAGSTITFSETGKLKRDDSSTGAAVEVSQPNVTINNLRVQGSDPCYWTNTLPYNPDSIGEKYSQYNPRREEQAALYTRDGADHLTVRGLEAYDVWGDGITFLGGDNIVVENVKVRCAGRSGISNVKSSNVTVTGGEISGAFWWGLNIEPFGTNTVSNYRVSGISVGYTRYPWLFAGGPNFNCRVYNVDATGNTALPTSTRPADIAPCAQVRF